MPVRVSCLRRSLPHSTAHLFGPPGLALRPPETPGVDALHPPGDAGLHVGHHDGGANLLASPGVPPLPPTRKGCSPLGGLRRSVPFPARPPASLARCVRPRPSLGMPRPSARRKGTFSARCPRPRPERVAAAAAGASRQPASPARGDRLRSCSVPRGDRKVRHSTGPRAPRAPRRAWPPDPRVRLLG
jgi:hypothetical protein